MKQEFYDIALRKKTYDFLKESQLDADPWVAKYNELRPHNGKHRYGKTAM